MSRANSQVGVATRCGESPYERGTGRSSRSPSGSRACEQSERVAGGDPESSRARLAAGPRLLLVSKNPELVGVGWGYLDQGYQGRISSLIVRVWSSGPRCPCHARAGAPLRDTGYLASGGPIAAGRARLGHKVLLDHELRYFKGVTPAALHDDETTPRAKPHARFCAARARVADSCGAAPCWKSVAR